MTAYTGKDWGEWLVFTNDIGKLWAAQPTYMISQSVFLLAALVTFVHALSKGGRWPYFWLGTILHGLYADNFWHFALPDYDNFWHSQTPLMLLGCRMPVHIIFLYPAFMYHAAYAISKLQLPKLAEPFAVGLLTVLIDIPYDIVAVKFVHWTWHDTDPNIYDRHYWVPWNSYYFHATFTASFYFFFTKVRTIFDSDTPQWQSSSSKTEWLSLVIATILGMPGGVLMFIPIYHPLHDVYGIHSEVTFFLLFAIYSVFIINGLLKRVELTIINPRLIWSDFLMIMQLAMHYLIYFMFVVYYNPEDEISIGLHEPVGPCDLKSSLVTPFGQKLEKRKYFCPTDYNEDYFDFHCVGGKIPLNGSEWYTICGTPFKNRSEYIVVLTTILVLASGIFGGIYTSGCRKKNQKDTKATRTISGKQKIKAN